MSAIRKLLLPLLVVLSLQFLSSGLLTGKGFSPAAAAPRPLTALTPSRPCAAAFGFPIDPDGRQAVEADQRPKARVGEFLIAGEYPAILPRAAVFIEALLAAKVSRFLSKSVLNL